MIIAFIRKNDGELFTLNEDKKTYSIHKMKLDFPDNIVGNWGEWQLSTEHFTPISMERNIDNFKYADKLLRKKLLTKGK